MSDIQGNRPVDQSLANTLDVVPQNDSTPADQMVGQQPVPPPSVGSPLPLGHTTATGTPAPALKKPRTGKIVGLIVAVIISGGAAGFGGIYVAGNLFSPTDSASTSGPATVIVNDVKSANQTAIIAKKVVPSSVTIEAVSQGGRGSGTGSGVVLTEDGYVVTNAHVVALAATSGYATIRVTTSDGRVFDATVVGADPTYDLAVIKLQNVTGLTPIEFADSSSLNVGDTTIAVGAPLGFANTVTTGIVSALNRSIEIVSSVSPNSAGTEPGEGDQGQQGSQVPPFLYEEGQQQALPQDGGLIKIAVIQTDAAINPGNSGGALVDSGGGLIGINVAIATAGGTSGQPGSIGMGFSIPSNIVQRITDEIIENGEATHGLLNANVISAALVEGPTITGAYIAAAPEGGAAAAAGLQEGDVVTAFNNIPVTNSIDLIAQVRAVAAGSEATITFVRNREPRTVSVTLEQ